MSNPDPIDRAVLEDDEPEGRNAVTGQELRDIQLAARSAKYWADDAEREVRDEISRTIECLRWRIERLVRMRSDQEAAERRVREAEAEMQRTNPTTNPNPEGTAR